MECLVSMWRTEGCIDEGFGFPENLTRRNLDKLRYMEIRFDLDCIF